MLKRFSKEGQFECDFAQATRGKLCALTPVVGKDTQGLGIAVANEPGYIAIPFTWCNGDNHDELQAHANELNRELFGIEPEEAMRIVCSSMFPVAKRGAQSLPKDDPIRFRNFYQHCGQEWSDDWSCTSNDECPVCGGEIEPYKSEDI